MKMLAPQPTTSTASTVLAVLAANILRMAHKVTPDPHRPQRTGLFLSHLSLLRDPIGVLVANTANISDHSEDAGSRANTFTSSPQVA
jgi:hypothetical protein